MFDNSVEGRLCACDELLRLVEHLVSFREKLFVTVPQCINAFAHTLVCADQQTHANLVQLWQKHIPQHFYALFLRVVLLLVTLDFVSELSSTIADDQITDGDCKLMVLLNERVVLSHMSQRCKLNLTLKLKIKLIINLLTY